MQGAKVEVSSTHTVCAVSSSPAGCGGRSRPRECREQGVSPHGISYARCRIRGLIAPPHNVNMPRQLTAVCPRTRVRARARARVNETGRSVIRANAAASSLATRGACFASERLHRFLVGRSGRKMERASSRKPEEIYYFTFGSVSSVVIRPRIALFPPDEAPIEKRKQYAR